METENHVEKCQFCALLKQATGNSPNSKIISQDEDFVLLGLMEKDRMGMIIMSTLHNNWDVRNRTKTHKLVKLIKMATALLNGDIKIISCHKNAGHYYIKIFLK
jgi:hypothetical protein